MISEKMIDRKKLFLFSLFGFCFVSLAYYVTDSIEVTLFSFPLFIIVYAIFLQVAKLWKYRDFVSLLDKVGSKVDFYDAAKNYGFSRCFLYFEGKPIFVVCFASEKGLFLNKPFICSHFIPKENIFSCDEQTEFEEKYYGIKFNLAGNARAEFLLPKVDQLAHLAR